MIEGEIKMNINKLPDVCPRCGHTIFKQKIAIEGYADKLYVMTSLTVSLDHPMMVIEKDSIAHNDFYNDTVCNACGALIAKAEVNK